MWGSGEPGDPPGHPSSAQPPGAGHPPQGGAVPPPVAYPLPIAYLPPGAYTAPTAHSRAPVADGPGPAWAPPPRAAVGLPQPVAFESVSGTPFAVAIVGVAPTTSGPATASLVAGVGSILIALVVGCFGALGSQDGWGPTVAGAFAVLALLVAVAALALGRTGLRQVRRRTGWGGVKGRGLALSGIICGASGLALTAVALTAAIVLTTG